MIKDCCVSAHAHNDEARCRVMQIKIDSDDMNEGMSLSVTRDIVVSVYIIVHINFLMIHHTLVQISRNPLW